MDEIRHAALKSEALLFSGPKHMRDAASLAAVHPRDKARRLHSSNSVPTLLSSDNDQKKKK